MFTLQSLFLNLIVIVNYIFTCFYVLYDTVFKCLQILIFMIQNNLSDEK